MDSELKLYWQIARDLYPSFTPEDGVSNEEIERTEKVYEFHLPKVLREFYLMVGNHKAINYSHNRLLSVDSLEIEDNKLLFYKGHQGICYWAIDLSDIKKGNPPVWIGQLIEGQDELEWYLDFETLSDFLLVMLCWQSVMGGLHYVGLTDKVEETVTQIVKNNFSPLEFEENFSGFQVFTGKGKVICLATGNQKTSVYAGASDEEKFIEIEDLLKIEWDYCFRDD